MKTPSVLFYNRKALEFFVLQDNKENQKPIKEEIEKQVKND